MRQDQDQDPRPSGCTPLGCLAIALSWAVLVVAILVWYEAMACLGFLQSR